MRFSFENFVKQQTRMSKKDIIPNVDKSLCLVILPIYINWYIYCIHTPLANLLTNECQLTKECHEHVD